MAESAVATQHGIAVTLRQTGTTGRHRKTSQAAGWAVPRQARTSHAARGPAGRHRKTSPAAASKTAPRHRKTSSGQAVFSRFVIGQGNSVWAATRRAALPSALALGLLTVGGAITGAFGIPSLDATRADINDPGNITHGSMPPSQALTAMATPSPDLGVTQPPMADRGVRAPIEASGPALPITDQAADLGGGEVGAGEAAQSGTTTRVTESRAFAPSVIADPAAGHGGGGGGGPSESTEAPEPPLPPGLFDRSDDDASQAAGTDDGPGDRRDEVRSPRSDDGPGNARSTNGHRGGDSGGSHGHNGGGGQHRRGGSHG